MKKIKILIGIATAALAMVAASQAQSWITNGLVAYYPLNGNANDASGNGNNLTVTNVSYATDRIGNVHSSVGLTISSNSLVHGIVKGLPIGTNSRSISMWFKANTNVPTPAVYDLFLYGAWSANQAMTITIATNGHAIIKDLAIDSWHDFSSHKSYLDGNWHQILVSYNSQNTNLNVYYDSFLLPATGIPQFNTVSSEIYLGSFFSQYTSFNGWIDDVRIYNRALNSSDVANLFAIEAIPPSILQQPITQIVNAYDSPTFSLTANGSSPFFYQWRMNGTNLPNATNSSYTITKATQSDLGAYVCVITNVAGSITSSPATLYMNPYIATPFNGAVTYWGQSANLGVTAWGSGLNYQWYFNGSAIAGANTSTFNIASVQFTNAGLYSVVVSSVFGSVTNAPYQVVVNPANVSVAICPNVVIQGTVGYSYVIQSTTDLSNTNSWMVETNITLTQPIQFWDDTAVDTSKSGNSHKFYRVIAGQ